MSFLLLCLGFLAVPGKSLAASAVVEFSTDKTEVKKDETVTVVCRVTSKDGFNDVKMKVSYDSDVLQFIEGGKKVSGGNGQLSIQSVGNTDAVTTRTYSLQFQAVGEGATAIQTDGNPKILDSEGNKLSISSNRIVLSVTAEEAAAQGTVNPADPAAAHNCNFPCHKITVFLYQTIYNFCFQAIHIPAVPRQTIFHPAVQRRHNSNRHFR
mgnify:CR=1 FL=1